MPHLLTPAQHTLQRQCTSMTTSNRICTRVASDTHLFKPKDAYRMPGGGGFNLPATSTIGKNPANGVVVYYSLKAKPTTDVVLEFLDSNAKSIRKFTGALPRPGATPGAEQQQPAGGEEGGFFGG